ncbi:MAG: hypothetical protein ACXACX_13815 [Candidatus Hodarchaeales archaeon]
MNPKRKKFTKGNIGHLFEKLGHKTDTKDIYETNTQQQSIKTQNEITKDFHKAKLFQVKNWLFGEMLGYVESGYSDFLLNGMSKEPNQIPYFEGSILEGENINEALECLAKAIISRKSIGPIKPIEKTNITQIYGVGKVTAKKIRKTMKINYVEEFVKFKEKEIIRLTKFGKNKTKIIINEARELLG